MAKTTIDEKFNQLAARLETARTRAQATNTLAQAGGLTTEHVRNIVQYVATDLQFMGSIPRTAGTAARAADLWDYQGGTLAADFVAIETALHGIGNWIAARSSQLWTGYALAPAYPWAETIPSFTAAQTVGLRTELNALIAAINTFLGNIP